MEEEEEWLNLKLETVRIKIFSKIITFIDPENMKHYYNGYTEQNAVEFDNRWNQVTSNAGYKSSLGQ